MKEKRNRKLRINYGGKIQLQKLLFLIPIVIIILVFIMYREAGAYRAEEKLYTYMGEVQTEYPEGTKYTVLAPILLREDRTLQQQLEIDMKQGFTRLEVNGEMMRIDEYKPKEGDTVFLLIDRMTASSEKDSVSRLTDSAETAMYEGDGACLLRF